MSTTIKYNAVNPFLGQPTPFATKSQEMIHYGKRWGQSTRLTLAGQITGNSFADLVAAQNQIVINLVTKQFKTLEIYDDLTLVYSLANCKVESASFDESVMAKTQEYSVSIVGHESSTFSGVYGVLNPQESVNFSDNQDGTVSMTHSVSAKGFNTSAFASNAFENAASYVLSLTGWNSQVLPSFANQGLTPYPILLSRTEKIDRLAATYSTEESYIFNASGVSNQPLLIISASVQEGIEQNFTTVDLNVDLKGGKSFGINNLRTYAAALNLHNLAEYHSSVSTLLAEPISYSVDEDLAANTISIKASFDDNSLFSNANAYFDHSVSFDTDHYTNRTEVKIKGDIIGRGHGSDRIVNAENFLNNQILSPPLFPPFNPPPYLTNIVTNLYAAMGFLFPDGLAIPTSMTIQKNPLNGTISVEASYSDKDRPNAFTTDARSANIEYSVKIKPSLPTFKPIRSFNEDGYYLIYDLNSKNRENIDFNINTTYNQAYDLDQATALYNAANNALAISASVHARLSQRYLSPPKNLRLNSESSEFNRFNFTLSSNSSFSQDEFNATYPNLFTIIKRGP